MNDSLSILILAKLTQKYVYGLHHLWSIVCHTLAENYRIVPLPVLSSLPLPVESSSIKFSWQFIDCLQKYWTNRCLRFMHTWRICTLLSHSHDRAQSAVLSPSFRLSVHCFLRPTSWITASLVPFCPLLQVKLEADTQKNMSHTLARIQARLLKSAWLTNLLLALVTKSWTWILLLLLYFIAI